MHVDHVRPLAKGGKHCLHNLQLLTPLENMRKGAKWAEAA
jgi:5-methylcytosine-specific restriction endonuclease McrA